MKLHAKDEEEAEKIIDKLDELTELLLENSKIPKEKIPSLREYLNEELLELHYCRKGTRIHISTKDLRTRELMFADIIGHLLSELPENRRNDVLLMAINTLNLDDMVKE